MAVSIRIEGVGNTLLHLNSLNKHMGRALMVEAPGHWQRHTYPEEVGTHLWQLSGLGVWDSGFMGVDLRKSAFEHDRNSLCAEPCGACCASAAKAS